MAALEKLSEILYVNSSEVFTYHSGVFVSDGHAVVVDPGLSQQEIKALAQNVHEQDWMVDAVILTHGHWDHVLGTEAFPNARVIAQQVFLTSPRNDPNGIQRIVNKTPDVGRSAPFVMPVPKLTFDSSMTLPLGTHTLELIHTPGHAPDHLFVHERVAGLVWTADMLSDEELPYVIDNLGDYTRTMEKLRTYDFQMIVPCHGTATRDANEIRARLEGDRTYLIELQGRVQQAVSDGKTLYETTDLCADIPYRQAVESNQGAHRRNIESAYVELGGRVDGPVGWQHSWLEFTS